MKRLTNIAKQNGELKQMLKRKKKKKQKSDQFNYWIRKWILYFLIRAFRFKLRHLQLSSCKRINCECIRNDVKFLLKGDRTISFKIFAALTRARSAISFPSKDCQVQMGCFHVLLR